MYLSRGLGSATPGASSLVQSLAPSYGVPPSLALAVANQESGFNQSAVSSAGAVGVMQLMPGTASDLGVNPADLTGNLQGGLQYLSQMYQKFGNWFDALVAYNAGPGKVSSPPASSSAYASSILSAAGLSSSVPSKLSVDTSVDTSGLDLSALTDASTGLISMTAWAAIGIGLAGLIWWATA